MSGTAIPLAVDPTAQAGPNVGNALAQAQGFIQLQQQKQQFAGQNALKGILGNPASFDPTGNINPSILPQVGAVDPNAMLTLRQNMLADQTRNAQLQKLQLQRHDDIQEAVEPLRVASMAAYTDALQNGLPQDAALAAGQKVYTEELKKLTDGGLFSDQEKTTLNTQFDPQRVGAMSTRWQGIQKQRQDEADKQKELAIRERAAGQKDYGTPLSAQYTDPDTHKPATGMVVYDKGEGKYLTADGRKPIEGNVTPYKPPVPGSVAADREAVAGDVADDPLFKDKSPGERAAETERRVNVVSGKIVDPKDIDSMAQSIASYQQAPLSGYAMSRPGSAGPAVMAKVLEINPDYQASRFPEVNKAMTAFGTGKQGDTVRYINNAIQHIDVMQQAADALHNGDEQTFNSLMQRLNQEFGTSAPTTFDGLKQIVGTEIERAATGGVGAAVDRDRLMESMQRYNSPEQLKGAFDGFRSLFRGQANSLKNQYEDATGFKAGPFAFDNKLLPETKRALGIGEKGVDKGASPTAGGAAPPAAAIDELKANATNPVYVKSFEKHFGSGSAQQYLGAPASTPAQAPGAASPTPGPGQASPPAPPVANAPSGHAVPDEFKADPDGTTYNGGKFVKRGGQIVPVQ